MPRPRQPGRHRRPEPLAAPEGAAALVIAIPGTPSDATRALVDEVVSIARSELAGLDIRTGYLDAPTAEETAAAKAAEEAERRAAAAEAAAAEGNADGEAEFAPPLEVPDTFIRFSEDRPDFPALVDVLASLVRGGEEESRTPAAVVVPLVAGPEESVFDKIRAAVETSGVRAELTDALGPHPLLAEALHVRLSEAGLARADRARLFTVATAADGIILASFGGTEAVQAAGVTGLLLAARLAIPVLAAGLDVPDSIAETAAQLRSSGSGRLALAPCVIGPEVPEGLLASAIEAAGCDAAEPLAAYPAVGKLVVAKYMSVLGIAPQEARNAPVH
jgi:hypothetical protein